MPRSRRRWRRAPIRPRPKPSCQPPFVAYASDVSTGRVRANRVDKEIDIIQRKADKAELLQAAADASDFAAYLATLPPKGDYPALQKALAAWREKKTPHDLYGHGPTAAR